MTLNQYQQQASQTAIYQHSPLVRTDIDRLNYVIAGLAGEAGEVSNKWKKVLRGDASLDASKSALVKELGGVLWYISQAAKELGYDLDVVAMININALQGRAERGTLKGSGDER